MQTHLSGPGDETVIAQILAGDVNAFEILLNRYQAHILLIVKKHVPPSEIVEVVQDVFVRAYQSLPNFSKTGRFKQWLSAVAVRTCYDFWRQRYRNKELPLSSLSDNAGIWLENALAGRSEASFQAALEKKEAGRMLDAALRELSPENKMVLELVYLEGHSVKEAATLLGWSVSNVKVRSFRSRKKLEKILAKIISA